MKTKLRVVMTDHGRGAVFLDDVELKNVVCLATKFAAGKVNHAEVTLLADQVEIEAMADVTCLRDHVHRFEWRRAIGKQCSYPNDYFAGGLN